MNYRRTFLALVATLAFAACASSKPAHFYSLSATAAAGAVTNVVVLVGPVTIPASVDQTQFVVQVAAIGSRSTSSTAGMPLSLTASRA